jgi:hypothetical protein
MHGLCTSSHSVWKAGEVLLLVLLLLFLFLLLLVLLFLLLLLLLLPCLLLLLPLLLLVGGSHVSQLHTQVARQVCQVCLASSHLAQAPQQRHLLRTHLRHSSPGAQGHLVTVWCCCWWRCPWCCCCCCWRRCCVGCCLRCWCWVRCWFARQGWCGRLSWGRGFPWRWGGRPCCGRLWGSCCWRCIGLGRPLLLLMLLLGCISRISRICGRVHSSIGSR